MKRADDKIVIKIYGDSLSLPRPLDGVCYGEEYANLLQERLADSTVNRDVFLYNRSEGGATVVRMFKRFKDDRIYLGEGGIVVIQCGVVDCALRPLPKPLRLLLGYAPGFARKAIVAVLHRNRARILKAGLGTRLTSAARFRKVVSQWLREAESSQDYVLLINIAPTNPATEEHSPGFTKSIEMFNKILHESVLKNNSDKVRLVDIFQAIKDRSENVNVFINKKDGHHLTREGHLLYADTADKELKIMMSGNSKGKTKNTE
jgi:hypothetical protein